jgi:catechol 2,3-dioxygenase-like lactoylglutathione lyase family enzyme
MSLTFKKSNNVAVLTDDLTAAKDFYSNVLNLPIEKEGDDEVILKTEDSLFYIIKHSNRTGPVLEFLVEDLEAARDHLIGNGCKVIKWEGKGKDCYLQDLFGVVFNLWEKS